MDACLHSTPPCCLSRPAACCPPIALQATHGCGDLIFSSHTTFVLTGVLTFTEYGETLVIKVRSAVSVSSGAMQCLASWYANNMGQLGQ